MSLREDIEARNSEKKSQPIIQTRIHYLNLTNSFTTKVPPDSHMCTGDLINKDEPDQSIRETMSLPMSLSAANQQIQDQKHNAEDVQNPLQKPPYNSESQQLVQPNDALDLVSSISSSAQCHYLQIDDNVWCLFVANQPSMSPNEAAVDNSSTEHRNLIVQRSSSGTFCRICYMGTEEGELMQACLCRGSVGWCHQHCLQTWCFQRQNYICEICHYPFNLEVNGLRWCWQWTMPVSKGQVFTQLFLYILCWIIMVFSVSSLIFMTYNLRLLFPDIITACVFIIMNTFTLLCSMGILLSQSMYTMRNICQRFCIANLDICILPYEEGEAHLSHCLQRNAEITMMDEIRIVYPSRTYFNLNREPCQETLNRLSTNEEFLHSSEQNRVPYRRCRCIIQ